MLLITLFLSTLCAVRLLAGSDLQPGHRLRGFAVVQIGSAGTQTGGTGVRAFFNHR